MMNIFLSIGKKRTNFDIIEFMKRLIVANWKMNPDSLAEAKRIFNEIKRTAGKLEKVETVICPPFVYLSVVSRQSSVVGPGSQDIFWQEGGSYTGEISAGMLKDLGVKHVIIGHSERREHLGETNEIINKKIKAALKAGLKVVFCVGEKERESGGGYLRFIKEEIEEGLKGVQRKYLKNLIVAYEPIWAIGKGRDFADSPEDVLQMALYIRKTLLPIAGRELARKISILYGGSVEPKNAEGFLKDAGVQGLLVGHESLISKDFNQILRIANGV